MTWLVTISHSQCESFRLRFAGRGQYDATVATLHTAIVFHASI